MKKNHWSRRVLSLLLCLVLVLGFFPAGAIEFAAAADTGYVTDNLVLYLDANNNTGSGFDANATTWKNLAPGGEEIKVNGQTWGTESSTGAHYLSFNENYILLPDSVRQALAGSEFTIEFVMDGFVDGGSGINNIMCVTGADSYIAQFKANGGTKDAGAVVNDNFVIWSNAGGSHNFRTCVGTGSWSLINNYAAVGNGELNGRTNSLNFSSTAGNKWYQNGMLMSSGSNKTSGTKMTMDGYLENGTWQTTNKPQVAFGAATDVVSGRHFKGNVKAIRVYADTLTTAEIVQNSRVDTEKYYSVAPAAASGYVTEDLVLYLDANKNTGTGFDANSTTWKNLAGAGELVELRGQSWGTDSEYGTHYLSFDNNYVLLPDSVREALSGSKFTVEFIMDDFSTVNNNQICNIMCVTGDDNFIASFKANGGEADPGGTTNDSFVIFANENSSAVKFRTCYGTTGWTSMTASQKYAMADSCTINGVTNALVFDNSSNQKWYQDGGLRDVEALTADGS